MTFLYDAGYSIDLLRPKNEVKCLTQSAKKSICMGKGAVPNWGIFSPRSRGPFNTGVNFPSAHGSIVLGKLNSDTKRPGGWGEKNSKLESRGPIFADFRQFSAVWALFLKIQSAITPSILGVRGSSLDSRKLSPILFNNTPNQA